MRHRRNHRFNKYIRVLKNKSRKECCYIHAIRRGHQRYGLITEKIYKTIIEKIKDKSLDVIKYPNAIYSVYINGKKYIVSYDKNMDVIRTFLPAYYIKMNKLVPLKRQPYIEQVVSKWD